MSYWISFWCMKLRIASIYSHNQSKQKRISPIQLFQKNYVITMRDTHCQKTKKVVAASEMARIILFRKKAKTYREAFRKHLIWMMMWHKCCFKLGEDLKDHLCINVWPTPSLILCPSVYRGSATCLDYTSLMTSDPADLSCGSNTLWEKYWMIYRWSPKSINENMRTPEFDLVIAWVFLARSASQFWHLF